MNLKNISLFFLVFCFLSNSLFAQFEVKVTAYSSNAKTSNEIFEFIAGDSIRSHNSLANKSHSALLLKTLEDRGFDLNKESTNSSNCFIEYNYYISNGVKMQQKVPLPTFAPPTNINTNVQVKTSVNPPPTTTGITPIQFTEPAPINFPQPQLPSGYNVVEVERTIYTRRLILKCYTLNNGNKEELWIAEAESSGSSGDLNEVIPALIYAIKPHIGTNLRTPITLTIDPENRKYKKFLESN
jgi:hypothetical protein